MVKLFKMDTSISILKAPSVEQAFIGTFMPNFNGNLDAGKKIKNIGLIPRELLGLIVTSVIVNVSSPDQFTIGTEKFYGLDGVIVRQDIDSLKRNQRTALVFEQVYIPSIQKIKNSDTQTLLQKSLGGKSTKGSQYAKNINLIVMSEDEIPVEMAKDAIKELKYEFIVLISVLDPKPLHFKLFVLRNNDVSEFSECEIYLDNLTGIQQATIGNDRYLIINGVAAKTSYDFPLRWKRS